MNGNEENDFSPSEEIAQLPLLINLQPHPHSLVWIDKEINGGQLASKNLAQLQGERELLEQSRKEAWDSLEDFNKPMTTEALLRYADIAGKTGDIFLINRLDARIFYGDKPLIPDTIEDMRPFNQSAANAYRHRAIEFRDKSLSARRTGNIKEAEDLMEKADGNYSMYGTYALYAGEGAPRKQLPDEKIIAFQRNFKDVVEESTIIDLFFDQKVIAAYKELWESDLMERIINGEIEIPGVDRGWLAAFNKRIVTPEGTDAIEKLTKYLVQKHGISLEDFSGYSNYRLQEIFSGLSKSETEESNDSL